jgi:hypothetical protein
MHSTNLVYFSIHWSCNIDNYSDSFSGRIGVGVLSIAVLILVIAQRIYLGLALFAIMISIAFLAV